MYNSCKDNATLAYNEKFEAIDYELNKLDSEIINKANLVDGKVPASELPSYVDDAIEYANRASFPTTGESEKIYVAIDTGYTYRWSGSIYAQIGGKRFYRHTFNFCPYAAIATGYISGKISISFISTSSTPITKTTIPSYLASQIGGKVMTYKEEESNTYPIMFYATECEMSNGGYINQVRVMRIDTGVIFTNHAYEFVDFTDTVVEL